MHWVRTSDTVSVIPHEAFRNFNLVERYLNDVTSCTRHSSVLSSLLACAYRTASLNNQIPQQFTRDNQKYLNCITRLMLRVSTPNASHRQTPNARNTFQRTAVCVAVGQTSPHFLVRKTETHEQQNYSVSKQ
jgi:hypothetical protein